MDRKPVIFFDEATYNLWNVGDLKKTWMNDVDRIPIVKQTEHISSVTIYGAVSNIFDRVQLMTWGGTNTPGVLEFLTRLSEKVQALNLSCKPYLVMDNHLAHHARVLDDVYENFHKLWLPSYSSFLNS